MILFKIDVEIKVEIEFYDYIIYKEFFIFNNINFVVVFLLDKIKN